MITDAQSPAVTRAGSRPPSDADRLAQLLCNASSLGCQGRSKMHPLAPVENAPLLRLWVASWQLAGRGRRGGEPVGRAGAAIAARRPGVGSVAWGAREVAVFEAVAIALEREDLGVVDEPVDHCGGDDVVAEDLAPGAEGLVAGHHERRALVAARDEH